MKVLIVEDERHMAEAVAHVLKGNNYSVDISRDGEDGYYQALSGVYDIIVLDIMLPVMDGLSVLRRLRDEDINTPVLLLTARGGTDDKVSGLDCGADDYLAKPFEMNELLARLRALGRRRGEAYTRGLLEYGDIQLDPLNLRLRRGGGVFELTLKESQLLELLIDRRGGIVSKDSIIEKLWGFDGDAEDNNVEVYISFLRKKLRNMGAAVSIKTRRGAGYCLEAGDV